MLLRVLVDRWSRLLISIHRHTGFKNTIFFEMASLSRRWSLLTDTKYVTTIPNNLHLLFFEVLGSSLAIYVLDILNNGGDYFVRGLVVSTLKVRPMILWMLEILHRNRLGLFLAELAPSHQNHLCLCAFFLQWNCNCFDSFILLLTYQKPFLLSWTSSHGLKHRKYVFRTGLTIIDLVVSLNLKIWEGYSTVKFCRFHNRLNFLGGLL